MSVSRKVTVGLEESHSSLLWVGDSVCTPTAQRLGLVLALMPVRVPAFFFFLLNYHNNCINYKWYRMLSCLSAQSVLSVDGKVRQSFILQGQAWGTELLPVSRQSVDR